MDFKTTQEKKTRLSGIERDLRIIGEKLDSLWMAARIATGKEKAEIHKQIAPLREKMRVEREEQESLKSAAALTNIKDKQ